jgi:predicted DNA-binding helix-hairpin-helix protein
MEQLVEVARRLREEHQFRGYIHLKTIPDADPRLIELAGRYADRLSVNIELPTQDSVTKLAPEKSVHTIKLAMGSIRTKLDEKDDHPKAPTFAPAGQSTQMIVGADASDDRTILNTAQTLYGSYKLKRVYYSAFSPIPHSPSSVPSAPPPLLREHRLYQADFLLRGYGFTATELMPTAGNLALDIDPKLGWALANRDHFPLDLNRADEGMIARVPGIGLRTAKRLIDLRRLRRIRWEDLSRLRCSLKKLAPFVITADYKPAQGAASSDLLRRNLADAPQQMNLWPELQAA